MVSTSAKWKLDASSLDSSSKHQSGKLNPPGFSLEVESHKSSKRDAPAVEENEINLLKVKKAFDLAMGVAKGIPMNAIMLYMSGNSVQIFSVMITAMLFWNSLKAFTTINQAFERYEINTSTTPAKGLAAVQKLIKDPLLLPKLFYILCNIAMLGMGVWKCSSMGLLPTSHSDWLAFLDPKTVLEFSRGGLAWN
ncbi:uncharacterized protein BJ171DRAFT_497437 [Polychytrium aggregatum]|uniref:uncharacterized protein n=1 Tax=Polychytrium aggregatum TaxID=110093 RepID=UPI0022FE9616|nr:uncharacterized protein BJ171DRAFT_497437 [Polychytrium aggregatum]KAI9206360.1 hypothetical protein BJ171DRAFT_497437 [Polychytrium aggregatum]